MPPHKWLLSKNMERWSFFWVWSCELSYYELDSWILLSTLLTTFLSKHDSILKHLDRLACAECNEEHPTNIDGNCSEIFHRPVQWRCQGHGKDKTNLSYTSIQVIGPTGSFVEWDKLPAEIICFHVTLQKFQNEWFGEMVQSLKKTLPCNLIKHILKTAKPTITTNQLNRDLRSQVTGVLQSNAGSSSSMGFFSLAYQRFIRTNLQIPEIFPFPFRISGVLRSLWCHYFTPPKKKTS